MRVPEIAVGVRHNGIRHGEIGIELHGPLQQGQSGGVPVRLVSGPRQAVDFQRLQRRRGRFLQRHGIRLHGTDGLTEFVAQADGRAIQRLQHSLFAGGPFLRLGQQIAGITKFFIEPYWPPMNTDERGFRRIAGYQYR
jgi:hypothetical protein